ncbi:conserved hypothetical protein [Culex quinquefasciatus]|uniref:C2H2-type domain-containing protein n=1 Tax=Culex quinquefasciatus TaxID=7176 RepID=B0WWY7_CULQU|nr:conserved hypothetical protein [Culex quinquefasciatus]|eukprot:XP_001861909.1 conserved hypothetical protein [Culex quinquefasciatus]
MSFTKLQKYPFVCWLCLRPEAGQTMTPLDTAEDCFEGTTIRNYLAAMTCNVDENKRHLFPRSICAGCKKSLESFARFRTKVRTVYELLNGLVELRHANVEPIREFFGSNSAMLAELKVASDVEDLIAEFPQFQIASLPASMINSVYVEKIKTEQDGFEEVLFAVECLPQELAELKQEAWFEGLDYEPSLPDHDQAFEPEDLLGENESESEVDTKPVLKKRKYTRRDPNAEVKQKHVKLDEPLRCSKCSYKTHWAYRMQGHERTHEKRKNKKHHCKMPNCTEWFDTYSRLMIHVESKHRAHICELCGQQFSFRASLKDHMVRAHSDGEPKFSCEYCQASYKLKTDLHVHVRNIHRPLTTVHKCDICGAEFRFNHLLEAHKRWHGDSYDFPCTQCDKKFKNKHSLGKHTTKVHRERLFACDHCERMLGTKGSLLDHIEHVHEIQMRFVCEICVAVFESRDVLATHTARHQHPKQHECDQCLVVLPTEELFRDHVCITYRDDYVCCGRDLVSHQQYNKHQLVQHGTKVNARVKPVPGALLGRLRATRRRVETCPKCKAIFSTKKLRDEHKKVCMGGENDS